MRGKFTTKKIMEEKVHYKKDDGKTGSLQKTLIK